MLLKKRVYSLHVILTKTKIMPFVFSLAVGVVAAVKVERSCLCLVETEEEGRLARQKLGELTK